MALVYVALGSNLGDPLHQLTQAVKSLREFTTDLKISSFYTSQPMGPQDQPNYVNAVVQFNTDLAPLALLDKLQQIENEQGRVRLRRWGERTLDLDILLYDNQQIQSERLVIPHYGMQEREFVIVPLYDINPDLILPNGQSIRSIYQRFANHQMVKITD